MRALSAIAIAGLGLLIAAQSQAGSLVFFEGSINPGQTLYLPSPAVAEPIDMNVRPETAEGGGFYGFSEILIWATGDLVIGTAGFGCQAASCLFSPLPFVSGKSLTATGGEDLDGLFTAEEDVLTFSVSGTNGYLVIAAGEYIDATGNANDPGDAQKINVIPLVQVPEPSLLGLTLPGLTLLAGLARRRRSGYGRTHHPA
ncbi:MAG: PEP-CTERM sorting domain-containing protein [Myxococcota bacterium]